MFPTCQCLQKAVLDFFFLFCLDLELLGKLKRTIWKNTVKEILKSEKFINYSLFESICKS